MRIAVVNDMKMSAELLKRIVQGVPGYEVAWVAYDGEEAVKKCALDRPDLILMDLVMPVMDGVRATETIMKNSPCAILIVTATVSGHASLVFQAMGHGALDVVKTPVLESTGSSVDSRELLLKMERIGVLIGKGGAVHSHKDIKSVSAPPLLLIGSSTGGPMALVEVLSHLEGQENFATVIVQHVDAQFAPGLGKWLGEETRRRVEMVEEGRKPQKGIILLAGRNDHLIMAKGGGLHYTEDPVDNPYRPSVDVFYFSVAAQWPDKSVAVLLTGMGSDGGKGMRALRDAGWHTIAQDEATSVVFGMPRAAIALGGASEVLPLEGIAPAINAHFKGSGVYGI